jgi:hypothetical protein
MLFLILLLEALPQNGETTLMARQSGAPFVCYKEETDPLITIEESESLELSQEDQNALEEDIDGIQDLQS